MDNISEEYNHYWETNMFLQNEEFASWGLEEALSGYYDPSSPDSNGAWSTSKNMVSERNRRKKMNDRLLGLRSAVPKISKMDRASIIKDAINYIRELQNEESKLQAEISVLERWQLGRKTNHDQGALLRSKKKKTASSDHFHHYHSGASNWESRIEDIELRVSYMGDKTIFVSLTCSKRKNTVVKLSEVFELLKLEVISASTTAFSDKLVKTLLVEAEEEENDDLKVKIEAAITSLNDPHS